MKSQDANTILGVLRALGHPLIAVLAAIALVEAVTTKVVLDVAAPHLQWWVIVIGCLQSALLGALAALLMRRGR